MNFALSTCWFGSRQVSGEELVDEALSLGFDGLELGYGLMPSSVPGIMSRLASSQIIIESVHAFSPVPVSASVGHPELFRLTDPSEEARSLAVKMVLETLAFASSVGAHAVVLHAGRILPAAKLWRNVHDSIMAEKNTGWLFRHRNGKMLLAREKNISSALDSVRRSFDELLPEFEKAGVRLSIENLPSYDSVPLPDEMDALLNQYKSDFLACWYDIGHGQVMENAGYYGNVETLNHFLPRLAGVHIHDVIGPCTDHQAPGTGGIDFFDFSFLSAPSIIRVFEVAACVAAEDLRKSLIMLRKVWNIGDL